MERPAILVAPDKFKQTFRAREVAAAVGRGLESGGWEIDLCPVADGGDGTMETLLLARGGQTSGVEVHGPLGTTVKAGFALLEDGATAVVEVAAASGLALVAEHERDSEAASSRGTGELIVAAATAGAQVILVAAGGSATTDGGRGAIEAIAAAGGIGDARLVVLADVNTPFEHAAELFAPQKGADAAAVRRLSKRLDTLATTLARDPRGVAMTGAAGGLAGGLWAAFDARIESGAAFVLKALDFDIRMREARAVVVGEGAIDKQSLHGKVLGEIATRARQAGVPCHAVVGRDDLDAFDKRILDLQHVIEATTLDELEAAGLRLAALL